MAELPAGAVLGNYRVDWLIGKGGMGAVYLAQHVRMANRKAALKVLSPELAGDPEFRERFIRESDLAGSLEHPNIVPVYDAGEADGVLYCVMRYVRGTDLGAVLDLEGRLTPARTYAVLAAVGRALDFAHAHGLLHRDVKPGNIMLESRRSLGGRERVFLTDFGLVKRLESNTKFTRTGHLVGTLDYTAPEVFRGEELDARADVYSLGCVLYESLTGAVPFPGTTDAAVMYSHLQEEPPAITDERPELPEELDHVVRRAMAKHRSDRYLTCGDLVRAVRDALSPDAPVVVPIGDAPSLRPPSPTERFEPTRVDWADTEATNPSPMRVVPVTTHPERQPQEPTLPAPRRSWGARRVVSLAIAVMVLGAAVASGVLALRGNGGASPAPAARGPVAATIAVGSRPLAIAFGDDSAWVANSGDGTVSRINPATNTVVAIIRVGTDPQGVKDTGGQVWVANAGDDTVTEIDAATDRVLRTIRVGGTPEGVAFGRGSIWVTNASDNSVSRIDPTLGRVVDTVTVGPGPVAATFGIGGVWVANVGNNTLSRIDPRHDRVTGTFPVSAGVASVVFGDGSVWVTNAGVRHGFVTRINPESGKVRARIEVGPSPFGLSFADGALWVGQLFDGTVTRIGGRSNQIKTVLPIGASAAAVTFGDGDLWVTRGDGNVVRVRT
jgi:YVTN family beta-propeller protein